MPRPSKIEPVMIRPEEWLKRSSPPLGSQEGHHFGVDCVSIRYSTDEIGEGPNLHVHPYDEIFHVLEGRAQFTVGERQFEATAGSLVIGRQMCLTPTRISDPACWILWRFTSARNGSNTICRVMASR